MDTYFRNSWRKCVKCGRCAKACNEKGYGEIVGGRGRNPDVWSDNPCCHHCSKPCKEVCHYDAIKIERW